MRRLTLLLAAAGCVETPVRGGASTRAPTDTGAPAVSDVVYVEARADWMPDALPADRATPAFVDLDADGAVDLIEATPLGVVWHAGGAGGFSAPALLDGSAAATLVRAGDLDGVGDLDLLVSGPEGARVVLRGRDGAGAPTPLTEAPLRDALLVDLDGDGDLDAVTLDEAGLAAWRNTGGALSALAGGLSAAGSLAALAAGDFDGDGHTDLFVAGDADPDRLFLGDGGGGWLLAPASALPLATAPAATGAVAADLDADGDLDLYVPSSGQDRLLLHQAGGTFADETPFRLAQEAEVAVGAVALDFDLDGRTDLAVATADGPVRLLRQDPSGRFFDWSGAFPGAGQPAHATGLATADLGDDGDPDLFVGRSGLRAPWLLEHWAPEPLVDRDGDGVPDATDVCPAVPDPLQGDRDGQPFACEGAADCLDRTGCTLLVGLAGSAYLWCADDEATFDEARAACQERGADLVVLDDITELALLRDAGVGGVWLGLTDSVAEGSFTWVDGTAATWGAWDEGEPNDAGDGEDCAALRGDGTWNDLSCDREEAWVCEVAAPATVLDPGDACDVCPGVLDPDQADTDGDGLGDACDPE